MPSSFLSGCRSRFAEITAGVCRAVAACVGGGVRPQTLPADLLMAVYARVKKAETLLLALMERVRTGRQRGGGMRAAPVLTQGVRRVAPRPAVVLPRRFGWLVALVGYEAAGRGSQLAHLLTDPEMAVLLRDVKQARRILAPLCRMLGVADPLLAVERPVRVRPAKVVVPAVETVALERVGYVPSAKWPKGVITRVPLRLKRI
eukprot:gene11984-12073_t